MTLEQLTEAIRGALVALDARIEQGGHVIVTVTPEEFAKSVLARLKEADGGSQATGQGRHGNG